ncbi:hypothetical protein PSCLAVI8L_350050 [Pseudoclavibacter sp. 8L]|nr:hypothetical protein PSCLAVI8L_350050 [Pseudoclavibacter sp. 8L]
MRSHQLSYPAMGVEDAFAPKIRAPSRV